MIPYSRQKITKKDIDAVTQVLKSDFLTQGPKLGIFEKKIIDKVSSKYCCCVNSATSALHLSCLALGLKKDDIVWTVTNTFVASANCAALCNAKVDLIDIDNSTFNICIDELKLKLKNIKSDKYLPKIVIPVHFAGNPTNQKEIFNLSRKYGFKIIEDASHSLGSYQNKIPIGSCKYSDLTVFSFHPVKNITTAEGGAVLTNNKKLYERLCMLRNHGITKQKKNFHNKQNSSWYFEQQLLGLNYRMNELQAALGIEQLKNLEKFIKKRNQLAKYYIKNLKNLDLQFQQISPNNYSAYHLFVIVLKNFTLIKLNKLIDYFLNKNVYVQKHYIPIYHHPYYKKNFNSKNFPNTENYYHKSISLPLYYDLRKSEQDKVISIIKKFLN